jgi:hypothetical protein
MELIEEVKKQFMRHNVFKAKRAIYAFFLPICSVLVRLQPAWLRVTFRNYLYIIAK